MAVTLDSFTEVVRRSELVPSEKLSELLAEHRAANDSADARSFAQFLVEQKAITSWQAKKLFAGKSKGFNIGKYRLLSVLGQGGMGRVYLAEHTKMSRRVAIKVLPEKEFRKASYLERFQREARAVAKLDHPNIVRAFDIDVEKVGNVELHYLIMEYVDGASLQQIVAKRGPLTPIEAVNYLRQAADGLAHAHEAGLVHRDIKPDNLLVDKQGMVKLLDLGLARFMEEEGHSLTIEHDEKVIGTTDFLAPEQAVDSHAVDHRADIYGLGCTLFYLLSGRPPFAQGSLAQRIVAHQKQEPPALKSYRADVPASLEQLMLKLMAKDPDDRPATAAQVSMLFSEWLGQHVGASSIGVGVMPSGVFTNSAAGLSSTTTGNVSLASSVESGAASNVHVTRLASMVSDRGPKFAAGVVGAVATVLVLLGVIAGSIFTGDKTVAASTSPVLTELPPPTPKNGPASTSVVNRATTTPSPAAASKPKPPVFTRPAVTGDIITVGKKGNFATLGEAIAFAKANFAPASAAERKTIRLAAGETFRENALIGSRSGRDFPFFVKVTTNPENPATLVADTKKAPLQLAFTDELLIENLVIDANGGDVGLEMWGFHRNTTIRNVRIKGFGSTAVIGHNVQGTYQQRLTFDRLEIRGTDGNQVGMRLESDTRPAGELTIQRCRFIGPMATGIDLNGRTKSVDVRQTIFDGLDQGLRFTGEEIGIARLYATGNTYHDVDTAILFDQMPSDDSIKLAIAKSLFSNVRREFRVSGGADQDRLRGLFSNGGWVGGNVSIRNWPGGFDDDEYNIVEGGFKLNDAKFVSTNPDQDGYLQPQVERLNNAPQGRPPFYVGAVPGKGYVPPDESIESKSDGATSQRSHFGTPAS